MALRRTGRILRRAGNQPKLISWGHPQYENERWCAILSGLRWGRFPPESEVFYFYISATQPKTLRVIF